MKRKQIKWQSQCRGKVCVYYENPMIAFLSGNFYSLFFFFVLLTVLSPEWDQSSTVDTFIYQENLQNKAFASKSMRCIFFSAFSIYLSFSRNYKPFYKFVCYIPARHWLLLPFLCLHFFFFFSRFTAFSINTHMNYSFWVEHYKRAKTMEKIFVDLVHPKNLFFDLFVSFILFFCFFTLLPFERAICLRCHHCFFHFCSGQLHVAKALGLVYFGFTLIYGKCLLPQNSKVI